VRRSRNTVYNLHAGLVFVTQCRSPVFTATMLTCRR
jgi:hypothetical protein